MRKVTRTKVSTGTLVPNFARSDEELRLSIREHWDPGRATPWRCFLADVAERNVGDALEALAPFPRFKLNYSVKTNPRDEMIALMHRNGVLAECISPGECDQVREHGYEANEITYNGPRPIRDRRVNVAFADSVEGFAFYASRPHAMNVHGVRIRPHTIPSRFGVKVNELPKIVDIARASANVERLGVSFFSRPEDFGERQWREIADEVLGYAVELEAESGKPVTIFNLGGGFLADAWGERFDGDYEHVSELAPRRLSNLQQIYVEPGQGLSTPVEALFLRVIEVRQRDDGRETVVDGGQPNLPQLRWLPHRVFWEGDSWIKLQHGRDRIFGNICTEEDVIRHDVNLPAKIAPGDVIAVADAGSYDSSMSFGFGLGQPAPRDS